MVTWKPQAVWMAPMHENSLGRSRQRADLQFVQSTSLRRAADPGKGRAGLGGMLNRGAAVAGPGDVLTHSACLIYCEQHEC